MTERKKAQVTLFIIIGVITLIVVSASIYFRGGAVPVPERVLGAPGKAAGLQAFVVACLQDVAKDGIRSVGEHGGYIQPRLSINARQPTEGDGVAFAPGSRMHVPFWFFMASPNTCEEDCQFIKRRPPLRRRDGTGSIEEQLEIFIKDRVQQCVGDFKAFAQEGERVTATAEPIIRVTIGQDDVRVDATWELAFYRKGTASPTQVDAFSTVLPVNLREMYELADMLASLEDDHRYLEKAARNLIDAFSGTARDKLPPVTDLTFDRAGGISWRKSDVRENLKKILAAYIPFIQVFGTRDYRYITPPSNRAMRSLANFDAYYNRNFLIPLIEESHPSVAVHYSYLDWWPIYFDLNCRGEVCEPGSVAHQYSFDFFMQRYAFDYDLSFPVLLALSNPDALDGEGFTFNVMLEANMRVNKPLRSDTTIMEQQGAAAESLLCTIEQRTSPNITVMVQDAGTSLPVDANIMLSCGGESCDIGRTTNGVFEGPMPRCLGGLVGVFTPDRHPVWQPIDTYLDFPQRLRFETQPYYEVNVSVKHYGMYKVSDGNWRLDRERPVPVDPDDVSILQFERQGGPDEEPYATGVEVRGSYLPGDTIDRTLRITPGTYLVRIGTLHYPSEKLIIPAEVDCRKYRVGKTKRDCSCWSVPSESLVFDKTTPLPIGGVEFLWDVTADDLKDTKIMQFQAFRFMIDEVPLSCSARPCLKTSPAMSFQSAGDPLYWTSDDYRAKVERAEKEKVYIDCTRDANDLVSFAIQTEGVTQGNADLLPPIPFR